MNFIDKLKEYIQQNPSKFTQSQKMFVLRNIPRKGIGFFVETLNYYPDFIIWIKTNHEQKILFVDPKGLANMYNGFADEKIQLYKHIKKYESILAEKLLERGEKYKVVMESWIVSETPLKDIQPHFKTGSIEEYAHHHILLKEDREGYVKRMLDDKLAG